MGFTPMHVYVKAPIERSLRSGHSRFGTVYRELSDEEIQAVPPELRDALAVHVRESESWSGGEHDEPPCLELDEPSEGIDTIIAALRREHSERRRDAAKVWLAKMDVEWFEKDIFGDGYVIVDAVLAFSDVPEVAARIEQIKKLNNERWAQEKAADEGLREYAKLLPAYKRAAQEGYDIRDAAVDAYAKQIASIDEDAFVFRDDTDEFKRSYLLERKAPQEHAFVILEQVKKHLESLPKPKGVVARVGRIQRFRLATKDGTKWKLSVPVTVVPVWIVPQVTANRVILIFADTEEKQRYVGELEGDDIPF